MASPKSLQDLLSLLSGAQTGNSAQRNTDILSQWANYKAQPSPAPALIKADDTPSLLLNAADENGQRAAQGAQDWRSYFTAGMTDEQKNQLQKQLESQLTQMYPEGATDQDEATGQGRQYWDALRALAAARWGR